MPVVARALSNICYIKFYPIIYVSVAVFFCSRKIRGKMSIYQGLNPKLQFVGLVKPYASLVVISEKVISNRNLDCPVLTFSHDPVDLAVLCINLIAHIQGHMTVL